MRVNKKRPVRGALWLLAADGRLGFSVNTNAGYNYIEDTNRYSQPIKLWIIHCYDRTEDKRYSEI
jgi:hypothetical protein